jgi:hypothetical protein
MRLSEKVDIEANILSSVSGMAVDRVPSDLPSSSKLRAELAVRPGLMPVLRNGWARLLRGKKKAIADLARHRELGGYGDY